MGVFVEALYFYRQEHRTSSYTDIQFHNQREAVEEEPSLKRNMREHLYGPLALEASQHPLRSLSLTDASTTHFHEWFEAPPISSQLIKLSDSL